MNNRILVWHFGLSEQPAYYAERSYTPDKVRIHARIAPTGGDLQVDIRDDGATIFTNYPILPKLDNLNEMAEDFLAANPPIEAGSLITCHLILTNGAGDITVQLELESLDEEDEISE